MDIIEKRRKLRRNLLPAGHKAWNHQTGKQGFSLTEDTSFLDGHIDMFDLIARQDFERDEYSASTLLRGLNNGGGHNAK